MCINVAAGEGNTFNNQNNCSFIPVECFEEIAVPESGINVTSPGYPNYYPDNYDCTWLFYGSNDTFGIVINIVKYDIESDFLTIGHGQNITSRSKVARLTGTSSDWMIVVYESAVWINFLSDYGRSSTGYVLRLTPTYNEGMLNNRN